MDYLLPDLDDDPIAFVFGHYDDWYRRDTAPCVLLAVQGYEDYELEAIMFSHAIFASNFLNPN